MEQEVSDEVQAAMAIKLAYDVRKLIRDEVKAALEDYTFMNALADTYPMAETVFRNAASNTNFHNALKAYLVSKLQGY